MVIAYHLIFATYGFWLPNDPRGSWSDFVRAWELFWYGASTKVTTHRSLARDAHDRDLRQLQKSALRRDPVHFSAEQIESVARGFCRAVSESEYRLFACAILPEHVHMVVARHANRAEQMIGHFKARATQQLIADKLHPFLDPQGSSQTLPHVWATKGWKVFLNTDDDVRRAVKYVEDNPLKQRLPRQTWKFVTTL